MAMAMHDCVGCWRTDLMCHVHVSCVPGWVTWAAVWCCKCHAQWWNWGKIRLSRSGITLWLCWISCSMQLHPKTTFWHVHGGFALLTDFPHLLSCFLWVWPRTWSAEARAGLLALQVVLCIITGSESLFNWGIFHLGLSDLDFLLLINVLVDEAGSWKRAVHTHKQGRKRRWVLLLVLVDQLQICLHDYVVRKKGTMCLCDCCKASCLFLQYPQLCATVAAFPRHPPSSFLNN